MILGLPDAMAAVRGLHLVATLSLLGTASFAAWMLPAAEAFPDRLIRRLRVLGWASGLVAVLAGLTWFALQSATIADAETRSDLYDALPIVALHTRYGHTMGARLGLEVIATLAWLLRLRPSAALVPALIAAGIQGLIGHAGAAEGTIGDGLVLSEALHLVAAGVWLGALVPLWLSLRVLTPQAAAAVCERFSPIGLSCVLLLAGTGVAQGLQFIGSVPALLSTPYGHIALLKIGLFLLALVLAAGNRLWLTDRLADGTAGARRLLQLSVCVETAAGLAIVLAAAFMASSTPAAHTTPVWPLSWKFSLITVNEDPEFRQEVAFSLLAIGAAVLLMTVAVAAGRFRLVALGLLAVSAVLWGPSLNLLTVEAYPTSFQTSPTEFAAASILRGQALYGPNCATCHGAGGEGNGPAAASARIKPSDLTMPHLWEHTDGDMLWWLSRGIDDPEGGSAMPGFAGTLPADDRWALIDYVRANNAALALRRGNPLDLPIRAPAMAIRCSGVAATTMADLRGHAVLVAGGEAGGELGWLSGHGAGLLPRAEPGAVPGSEARPLSEIALQQGVTTVVVSLRDDGAPRPGSCVSADPAAKAAFAVLAGEAPDRLSGRAFLIDPDGWLRAIGSIGGGGWQTREALISAIQEICATKLQQANGVQHEHHH